AAAKGFEVAREASAGCAPLLAEVVGDESECKDCALFWLVGGLARFSAGRSKLPDDLCRPKLSLVPFPSKLTAHFSSASVLSSLGTSMSSSSSAWRYAFESVVEVEVRLRLFCGSSLVFWSPIRPSMLNDFTELFL